MNHEELLNKNLKKYEKEYIFTNEFNRMVEGARKLAKKQLISNDYYVYENEKGVYFYMTVPNIYPDLKNKIASECRYKDLYFETEDWARYTGYRIYNCSSDDLFDVF